MKDVRKTLGYVLVYLALGTGISSANTTDNQTDDLSQILPGSALPFSVALEQTNIQLPVGLHSGVFGVYQGLWILIAGRTNGLHGFTDVGSFPAGYQNTNIYVVNPTTGIISSRSLNDPSSGLSQQQIDTLSVTSPQGYQDGTTLYMTGGYGIDTNSGRFGTKPVLTAINLPGIVQWVTEPGNGRYSVVSNISQIYNPIFQITGGKMFKSGNITQLIFGQNFTGEYTSDSNGAYSEQVRLFQINNTNGQLAVNIYSSKPQVQDADFRRRDLNVMPVLLNVNNLLQYGFVAYAGVFTTETGVWTVPVVIDEAGNPVMADPDSPSTFKQGMNQYVCATAGLYSRKYKSMYDIFFGGMSYEFYDNGVLGVDQLIPFINQITTIQMDSTGNFTQYLMDSQYPVIPSTTVNPGNPLLFGAGAYFIPNNIPMYPNKVLSLDAIRKPTVIGYVVGGIASTVPDTNFVTDSFGSPYVFKVTLTPTG